MTPVPELVEGPLTHTFLSESDASATVAFLRLRMQTFIAYLYKPEAKGVAECQKET